MHGRIWFLLAGLFGAVAVAMGAFHAHGLAAMLERQSLDVGEIDRRLDYVSTAYRYQLLHAAVLFGIGVFLQIRPETLVMRISAVSLTLGMVLFCGSLYGLAFTDLKSLSRIAPFGGTALIFGWLCIAVGGLLTPNARAAD